MIFVTGDIHGDIHDFESRQLKKIKKGDTLIITGDFGFIWDNSKSELKNLKTLSKKKFKILFVEGSHENFDMLNEYEEVELYGSFAKRISDNIYCLKRGEIYTVEGKRIFALGGGLNDDDYDSTLSIEPENNKSMPTDDELSHAVDMLIKNEQKVELIITHEAPASVKRLIRRDAYVNDLNIFLDTMLHKVWYDHWYFGSLHTDKKVTNNMTCVWQQVIEIT